jgi:hypothetical protein
MHRRVQDARSTPCKKNLRHLEPVVNSNVIFLFDIISNSKCVLVCAVSLAIRHIFLAESGLIVARMIICLQQPGSGSLVFGFLFYWFPYEVSGLGA